jgi:hypothetical protein
VGDERGQAQHGSRRRIWLLGRAGGALLGLGLLASACVGEGSRALIDDGPTTTADPSPTASQDAGSTSLTFEDAGCDEYESARADVDGDGREDRVVYAWTGTTSVLGVCTASGIESIAEEGGQPETLEVADVDGDGRDEILYGGTSASATYLTLAVFDGQRLVPVPFDDGQLDQPGLVDGALEHDEAGAPVLLRTFGCEDRFGDARTELVLIEVRASVAGMIWNRFAYELRTGAAYLVGSDGGWGPVSDDRLADVRSLVAPCAPAAG